MLIATFFIRISAGLFAKLAEKQHKIIRFGHRSQPIRPLAEVVFGRTDWHPVAQCAATDNFSRVDQKHWKIKKSISRLILLRSCQLFRYMLDVG